MKKTQQYVAIKRVVLDNLKVGLGSLFVFPDGTPRAQIDRLLKLNWIRLADADDLETEAAKVFGDDESKTGEDVEDKPAKPSKGKRQSKKEPTGAQ